MAGRIFSVFLYLDFVTVHKNAKKKKKELRQYLAILTSRFINNAYLSIVLVLFFRYLTVYLNYWFLSINSFVVLPTQVTYEKVPYPDWAVFIVVVLVLMSVLFIPGVAIARYFNLVKYQKLEPVPLKEAEAKSHDNDFSDTNV